MTVSVLTMELCIVSLLLGWLWVVVAGSSWPVPFVALLPAVGGLVAGRLIPYTWRRINWFDAAWWATVAVFVAFLAELGNVLWPGAASSSRWNLLFVAGLFLAWRGWVIAEGWLDRELVEAELQLGTLAVLVLVGILAWQVPGAGLLPAIIFFGAGLVGMGIARRAERRGPKSPAETDWLALLGVMLVLLAIVCAGIVFLVTPDLLLTMAEQAFTVVTLALHGVAGLVAWFTSLFPSINPPTEIQPPTTGSPNLPPAAPPPSTRFDLPPFWIFEMVLIFCGLLFLAYGLRTVLRFMPRRLGLPSRMPKEKEPGPPVSEAPTFSWDGWWKLVLVWLRGWLSGTGRSSAGTTDRANGRTTSAPQEERSIRALYREFLTAAERAGFDRTPSTTPAELARTLERAHPTAQAPVTALTELYVRTRYGQEPAGRDEIGRMRSAVQRARGELAQRRPANDPD